MKKVFSFSIALLLLALSPSQLLAQNLSIFEEGSKYVRAELVTLHSSLQIPNQQAQVQTELGVHCRIAPGWHIYWKNSGETALPTQVKLTATNG